MTISASLLMLPNSPLPGLERILPYVDEAILVVVGASAIDKAIPVQISSMPAVAGKRIQVILINPEDNPELYRKAGAGGFRPGHSLVGEDYPGTSSDLLVVGDWSAVRNLGLTACTSTWRLSIDINETISHPEKLPQLCEGLEKNRCDLCAFEVRTPRDGARLEFRLSRNLPTIAFEGVAHESLEGGARPAIVLDDPKIFASGDVPDLRPSPENAFGLLYEHARQTDWLTTPASLLHLAKNAQLAGWPVPLANAFAKQAVVSYLEISLHPEGRAFAYCLLGDVLERQEFFTEASRCHVRSMEEYPNWKAAVRLCRTRCREGRWQDCLAAYTTSIETKDIPLLMDDGPEQRDPSLIFVAYSMHKLGRKDEAQKLARVLLARYPDKSSIAQLCKEIVP